MSSEARSRLGPEGNTGDAQLICSILTMGHEDVGDDAGRRRAKLDEQALKSRGTENNPCTEGWDIASTARRLCRDAVRDAGKFDV
ncbi:hypothetical protein L7F22_058229 [Adiantum nelumboides]|nr:hypothetical protein [Adiantum nelumboides]MCO5604072.1 hypothetical protein [Adiantum nelumboides]